MNPLERTFLVLFIILADILIEYSHEMSIHDFWVCLSAVFICAVIIAIPKKDDKE